VLNVTKFTEILLSFESVIRVHFFGHGGGKTVETIHRDMGNIARYTEITEANIKLSERGNLAIGVVEYPQYLYIIFSSILSYKNIIDSMDDSL